MLYGRGRGNPAPTITYAIFQEVKILCKEEPTHENTAPDAPSEAGCEETVSNENAEPPPEPHQSRESIGTGSEEKGEAYAVPPEIPAETIEQPPSDPLFDTLTEMNENLSSLRELFEKQIARNQNQAQMFNAVHSEMREYKGNFLLESIQKPIITDLVTLYDSVTRLESQFQSLRSGPPEDSDGEMERFGSNLENVRFELEEVLYRLQATPYEQRLERLDRKLHRTVEVKPTDDPEQDRTVAEVHKPGFYWRDKVFRPEEVTIFRYKPPTNDEGETENG